MFKKMFKNQRGLTLIELLAVVVILGIIAAIAIPAIGGMIQNSKIDAHIANAKQIANGARLYATTEPDKLTWGNGNTATVLLSTLEDQKHVEPIKDPEGASNATYNNATTSVLIKRDSNNRLTYYVKLIGTKTYIDETGANGVEARNLTRTQYKTTTTTTTTPASQ